MNRTSTLLPASLLALALHAASLHASCPSDRAGKMTSTTVEHALSEPREYFDWYDYFGEHPLGAASTITLDFALAPFPTGTTYIGLDRIGGESFLGLEFAGGMVNGVVPYDPAGWNDVRAVADIAAGSFIITVNGITSAPIPLDWSTTAPTASLQALRLHRFDDETRNEGWIDEVSIVERNGQGTTTLFSATFDAAPVFYDGTGSMLAETPPATLARPSTCPSKLVSEVPTGGNGTIVAGDPYPMPATTSITIPYSLTAERAMRVTVRDVSGTMVYQADLGTGSRGEHRVVWNCRSTSGAPLPAGSYFYTIEAGDDRLTGKIQLAR